MAMLYVRSVRWFSDLLMAYIFGRKGALKGFWGGLKVVTESLLDASTLTLDFYSEIK